MTYIKDCDREAGVSPSRMRIHRDALKRAFTPCAACDTVVELYLTFEDGSERRLSRYRFEGMLIEAIERMKNNITVRDTDMITRQPQSTGDPMKDQENADLAAGIKNRSAADRLAAIERLRNRSRR